MDAAIVGSGPNGLAAAVRLARAGLRVRVHEAEPTFGGGTRTAALTLPGFLHDVCSAVHPFARLSPFLSSLPLAEHGLTWIHPPIAIAHPLDDGAAIGVWPGLDATADELGDDADAYRRLIGPLAANLDALAIDVLAPAMHWPAHPIAMARFGAHAALSAKLLVAREFTTARARALFAGLAAHSFMALDAPFTASFPLLFLACAHVGGWPIARGGSQSIAEALVSLLQAHGGEVVLESKVESALPSAEVVLCDLAPANLARILGRPLPSPKPGPGVFKIDYALSAPVPWTANACRRAGTVHLGGTFDEIAASEEAVTHGVHVERPFVLVTQPSLFDPTRAPAGKHTLWAYCHVPNGSNVDMTEPLEAQIARFAPGFREVVLARSVMTCADLERHNANYIGGDISGGFTRPSFSLDPYATPAPNVFLCSASTPPGPGVHGMCGFHAAERALKHLRLGNPRASAAE